MASPISFQGLSSGLQTDKLVNAIIEQESQGLYRMQDRQALNNKKNSILRSLSSQLSLLSSSAGTLNNIGLTSNAVTSSDPNNTYVLATGSGAAAGKYEVQVSQLAKAAQSVVALPAAAEATTASALGLGGTADVDGNYHYTITNTSGEATDIALSADNNTLAGLRDAINSSSKTTGLSASVVQVDAAGKQFSLILKATSTGLASNGGKSVSVAAAASNSGSQVASGTVTDTDAQDAVFKVNGIELTRSSNTVMDAVQGLTLNLRAEGQTSSTTLTVAADRDAATKAMQDMVDKFNAVLKTYKDNTQTGGALAGESSVRTLISTVRSKIMSIPDGLPSDNTFKSAAELGLKTNRDGTMGLDTTAFKAALDKDPSAVAALFDKVGSVLRDTVSSITLPGSGNLARVIQSVDDQNTRLNRQISTLESTLDRRRLSLQAQYSNLEKTIGQLQAAGQSLGSL